MTRDLSDHTVGMLRVITARVLLLVASLTLSLALPLGSYPNLVPVPARAAQASHTCRNIQLLVRAQSSEGAAGTIGVIYRIHNIQGRACTQPRSSTSAVACRLGPGRAIPRLMAFTFRMP